jgi:hypothetical protein
MPILNQCVGASSGSSGSSASLPPRRMAAPHGPTTAAPRATDRGRSARARSYTPHGCFQTTVSQPQLHRPSMHVCASPTARRTPVTPVCLAKVWTALSSVSAPRTPCLRNEHRRGPVMPWVWVRRRRQPTTATLLLAVTPHTRGRGCIAKGRRSILSKKINEA